MKTLTSTKKMKSSDKRKRIFDFDDENEVFEVICLFYIPTGKFYSKA